MRKQQNLLLFREYKIYFKTEVKESNHNRLFREIVLKKTGINKNK
jgi:hypothetical protein